MSEHTKGPWQVDETIFDNDGTPETVITSVGGKTAIAVCLSFGKDNSYMREGNAQRIVDCVNQHDALIERIEELEKQVESLKCAVI